MMRSMFSGVSGLKSHQTRMDVIGNNIANVNTTGFKASRVTFADMISQNLSGASSPGTTVGGTNPKQIGLGTSVSSVDLLFNDGVAQSTGKNTDVALSGNGTFVVKKGNETYYTRNGAFEFDADGNYVMPGSGHYVQGWMANSEGKLITSGNVGNIKIPKGKSMNSEPTTTATYTNNLNASTKRSIVKSVVVRYADGTTENVTDYTPPPEDGKPSVSVATTAGTKITVDSTADYNFQSAAAGISLSGKKLWTSTVDSVTQSAAGQIKKMVLEGGTGKDDDPVTRFATSGTTLPLTSVDNGTYKVGGTYKVTGTIKTATLKKDGTIELEFETATPPIPNVIVPAPPSGTYKHGDTFTLNLKIKEMTAQTGAQINCDNGQSDTLEAADGDVDVNKAVQNYVRKGRASDGNVAAVARRGVVKSVTLSLDDGTSVEGLPGQGYKIGGDYHPSYVTNITTYDSRGGSHRIPMLFTKKGENEWKMLFGNGRKTYQYEEEDGTITTMRFATLEDLKFTTKGRYDGGTAVIATTHAGADDGSINCNLSGLTQYVGNNTIVGTTNGHKKGVLTSVSIDQSGVITGTYDNNVRQAEAQIAVAQFNNATGLTKMGGSLYQESNNSGPANVKTANDLGVRMTPSSLEMSNVDIADQFSDMIITQRGFQSNSKIITVSDEMLETLINMKR
ncbi:MAG: flagellar hook-basal body complex protein [Selenomonas artemidis]